jgi:hypothetical protein
MSASSRARAVHAIAKRKLLGITKAFAGDGLLPLRRMFRDDAVLTEAAIKGKIDRSWASRNFIIGKLIPAGISWAAHATSS